MKTSDKAPIPKKLYNLLEKELTIETEDGIKKLDNIEIVHDLIVGFYKKETDNDLAVIGELYKIIKKMGADHILLSLINSYKDTLDGEEVLNELKEINKK